MDEKLVGIRVIWDGKNLISKKGNKFVTSKFFTEHCSKTKLEKDLYKKKMILKKLSKLLQN
ncbi:hypothetical protein O6B72_05765 [Campylobacter ureolyticus]|uniref:hypothetical protein n=1 Tax=Campylobacter ureolyticus TaxID=827 RepID=UPI0022B44E6F|nr:hypothetical protein [Campylobacter ureolyticus]MCZ6156328.1 hypothetical protein [Campylobacter ureolyticus]